MSLTSDDNANETQIVCRLALNFLQSNVATGCLSTDSNWTLTSLSCSGLVLGVVVLYWVTAAFLTLRSIHSNFVSCSDVRVLGVTLSLDLAIDKHVSKVCSAGFYRLRQLQFFIRC